MNPPAVPRVSIIVPVFNSERYVGESIGSVLRQTFPDYELIVVDDGSTDGTSRVVHSFAGSIRYVFQANQGPAAARNTGLELARGELICFLDADDVWLPEKLACQVQFMDQHATVGLAFADEEEFDDNGVQCGSLIATSRFATELRAGSAVDGAYAKLLEENFIPTSMVIVRRSCVESVGRFDIALKGPEDRDFWSRIAAGFPVACLPRVLGRKRVVASSVSRDVEMTLRSRIQMWTKMRSLFPELAPARTINALLAPTYLQLGFVLLQKGQTREARDAAMKGFAVSRTLHSWLLAASLVVFTWIGKACTDAVFDTKRRLTGSLWPSARS